MLVGGGGWTAFKNHERKTAKMAPKTGFAPRWHILNGAERYLLYLYTAIFEGQGIFTGKWLPKPAFGARCEGSQQNVFPELLPRCRWETEEMLLAVPVMLQELQIPNQDLKDAVGDVFGVEAAQDFADLPPSTLLHEILRGSMSHNDP